MPQAAKTQFTKKLGIILFSAGLSLIALLLTSETKGRTDSTDRPGNQTTYAFAAGFALLGSGAVLSKIKTTKKVDNTYRHWQDLYQTFNEDESVASTNPPQTNGDQSKDIDHFANAIREKIKAITDFYDQELLSTKNEISLQESVIQNLTGHYQVKKHNLSELEQQIQQRKAAGELERKELLRQTKKINNQSNISRKLLDDRLQELTDLVSKKAHKESQSIAINFAAKIQQQSEITHTATELANQIQAIKDFSQQNKKLFQESLDKLLEIQEHNEQSINTQRGALNSIESNFSDEIKRKKEEITRLSNESETQKTKIEILKKQIKDNTNNTPLSTNNQARLQEINFKETIDELTHLQQQAICDLEKVETSKKNYEQTLKNTLEASVKSVEQETYFCTSLREQANLEADKSIAIVSSLESLLNEAKNKHNSLNQLQQATNTRLDQAENKLKQLSEKQQEIADASLIAINAESESQKQSLENLSEKIVDTISYANSALTDLQRLYEQETSKKEEQLKTLNDSTVSTIKQSQSTLKEAKILLTTELKSHKQEINNIHSAFKTTAKKHRSLDAEIEDLRHNLSHFQTDLNEKITTASQSIGRIFANSQSTKDSSETDSIRLQTSIASSLNLLKGSISEASVKSDTNHQVLEKEIQSVEAEIKSHSKQSTHKDALNQRQIEELYTSIHNLENSHQSIEKHLADTNTKLSQKHGTALNELNLLIQKFELTIENSRSTLYLQKKDKTKANMSPSGFSQSYEQACQELSLEPGSPWITVRETWRRNVKIWHPDRGGNPKLWNRRQAAYQLLAAWYEFKGS